MKLRKVGEHCAIMEGEEVLATFKLQRSYNDPNRPLIITDLEGTGNAAAIKRVVSICREIAKTEPVLAMVMQDNPKHDKLVSFYEKVGMKRQPVTIMGMGLKS